MQKTLIRIVAVLLVPCLLSDLVAPAGAAMHSPAPAFQQVPLMDAQAFSPVALPFFLTRAYDKTGIHGYADRAISFIQSNPHYQFVASHTHAATHHAQAAIQANPVLQQVHARAATFVVQHGWAANPIFQFFAAHAKQASLISTTLSFLAFGMAWFSRGNTPGAPKASGKKDVVNLSQIPDRYIAYQNPELDGWLDDPNAVIPSAPPEGVDHSVTPVKVEPAREEDDYARLVDAKGSPAQERVEQAKPKKSTDAQTANIIERLLKTARIGKIELERILPQTISWKYRDVIKKIYPGSSITSLADAVFQNYLADSGARKNFAQHEMITRLSEVMASVVGTSSKWEIYRTLPNVIMVRDPQTHEAEVFTIVENRGRYALYQRDFGAYLVELNGALDGEHIRTRLIEIVGGNLPEKAVEPKLIYAENGFEVPVPEIQTAHVQKVPAKHIVLTIEKKYAEKNAVTVEPAKKGFIATIKEGAHNYVERRQMEKGVVMNDEKALAAATRTLRGKSEPAEPDPGSEVVTHAVAAAAASGAPAAPSKPNWRDPQNIAELLDGAFERIYKEVELSGNLALKQRVILSVNNLPAPKADPNASIHLVTQPAKPAPAVFAGPVLSAYAEPLESWIADHFPQPAPVVAPKAATAELPSRLFELIEEGLNVPVPVQRRSKPIRLPASSIESVSRNPIPLSDGNRPALEAYYIKRIAAVVGDKPGQSNASYIKQQLPDLKELTTKQIRHLFRSKELQPKMPLHMVLHPDIKRPTLEEENLRKKISRDVLIILRDGKIGPTPGEHSFTKLSILYPRMNSLYHGKNYLKEYVLPALKRHPLFPKLEEAEPVVEPLDINTQVEPAPERKTISIGPLEIEDAPAEAPMMEAVLVGSPQARYWVQARSWALTAWQPIVAFTVSFLNTVEASVVGVIQSIDEVITNRTTEQKANDLITRVTQRIADNSRMLAVAGIAGVEIHARPQQTPWVSIAADYAARLANLVRMNWKPIAYAAAALVAFIGLSVLMNHHSAHVADIVTNTVGQHAAAVPHGTIVPDTLASLQIPAAHAPVLHSTVHAAPLASTAHIAKEAISQGTSAAMSHVLHIDPGECLGKVALELRQRHEELRNVLGGTHNVYRVIGPEHKKAVDVLADVLRGQPGFQNIHQVKPGDYDISALYQASAAAMHHVPTVAAAPHAATGVSTVSTVFQRPSLVSSMATVIISFPSLRTIGAIVFWPVLAVALLALMGQLKNAGNFFVGLYRIFTKSPAELDMAREKLEPSEDPRPASKTPQGPSDESPTASGLDVRQDPRPNKDLPSRAKVRDAGTSLGKIATGDKWVGVDELPFKERMVEKYRRSRLTASAKESVARAGGLTSSRPPKQLVSEPYSAAEHKNLTGRLVGPNVKNLTTPLVGLEVKKSEGELDMAIRKKINKRLERLADDGLLKDPIDAVSAIVDEVRGVLPSQLIQYIQLFMPSTGKPENLLNGWHFYHLGFLVYFARKEGQPAFILNMSDDGKAPNDSEGDRYNMLRMPDPAKPTELEVIQKSSKNSDSKLLSLAPIAPLIVLVLHAVTVAIAHGVALAIKNPNVFFTISTFPFLFAWFSQVRDVEDPTLQEFSGYDWVRVLAEWLGRTPLEIARTIQPGQPVASGYFAESVYDGMDRLAKAHGMTLRTVSIEEENGAWPSGAIRVLRTILVYQKGKKFISVVFEDAATGKWDIKVESFDQEPPLRGILSHWKIAGPRSGQIPLPKKPVTSTSGSRVQRQFLVAA